MPLLSIGRTALLLDYKIFVRTIQPEQTARTSMPCVSNLAAWARYASFTTPIRISAPEKFSTHTPKWTSVWKSFVR